MDAVSTLSFWSINRIPGIELGTSEDRETCRAASSRGWGSGTLPSQLNLCAILQPSDLHRPVSAERRRPREAEREGDQQSRGAQPHFHPLLPSGAGGGVGTHAQSRPVRGCSRGKTRWKEGMDTPPSWQVREQARSCRPKDPRKVHGWHGVGPTVAGCTHLPLSLPLLFL